MGASASPIATGAKDNGPREDVRVRVVDNAEAAEAVLADELAVPDVALFKSSRDAGLRWLGDRIIQREARS